MPRKPLGTRPLTTAERNARRYQKSKTTKATLEAENKALRDELELFRERSERFWDILVSQSGQSR